jgi:hypothetical protein
MTLLTSQWKSGKTTLVSVLLARMAQGGQLAGLPVAAARAVIVSEEGMDDWNRRCHKLKMADHVGFLCRPFRNKPTKTQWRALIDALLELHRNEGLDLVVIDPLAVFLPGNSENLAGVMTESLMPLRELTARGVGVLLLHHPRKGVTRSGQAARGSGALASQVDILIEMHWYASPDSDDRRRWLRAYSRHEETRRHLVLELTAGGDDYLAREALHDEAWSESWRLLFVVLGEASEPLTQQQILAHWPGDFRKPDLATVSRGLKRGLEQGRIRREGTGRRNEPYRYALLAEESDRESGAATTGDFGSLV